MIHHVLRVVPLADQKLELQFDTQEVRVAYGTVEWPQGLDLDPEDLYEFSIPV